MESVCLAGRHILLYTYPSPQNMPPMGSRNVPQQACSSRARAAVCTTNGDVRRPTLLLRTAYVGLHNKCVCELDAQHSLLGWKLHI